MASREELDRLARHRFGHGFDSLSAFAQQDIRHEAGQISMDDIDATRALQAAQQRIAQLERDKIELMRENKDLWEENEDLRAAQFANGEEE